jgi:16S rRNA processing protein RimM
LGKVSPEDVLLIGKVIRPHGLKGLLKIDSYAESIETFLTAGKVFLKGPSEETAEYAVASITPSSKSFLLKLDGLDTLEQAKTYRGWGLYILKRGLRRRGDDEYFWYELIGLPVYLDTGERVGVIVHILAAAGHDIFVVQQGDKEVLIPAVHDIIKEVDLENKKVVITEIEGLLDLNEV